MVMGTAVPLMLRIIVRITHIFRKTIINNTSFTNNYAEGYGGAIYTSSTTSPYHLLIFLVG
ncbi:hypothetical protein DMI65_25135 [Escherichia coli]|nr:hypothetical protein [Escherichia coli]